VGVSCGHCAEADACGATPHGYVLCQDNAARFEARPCTHEAEPVQVWWGAWSCPLCGEHVKAPLLALDRYW
jgi:hypothetical protein